MINMYKALIAATTEVEAWVKKALDKGAIDKHIDELQSGAMCL